MIDQNRDGFIDSEDLKDMLSSLGEEGYANAEVHFGSHSLHADSYRPGAERAGC